MCEPYKRSVQKKHFCLDIEGYCVELLLQYGSTHADLPRNTRYSHCRPQLVLALATTTATFPNNTRSWLKLALLILLPPLRSNIYRGGSSLTESDEQPYLQYKWEYLCGPNADGNRTVGLRFVRFGLLA